MFSQASRLIQVFSTQRLLKGQITSQPGPEDTHAQCILLINVKMPTIVGILTFIDMINTTSDLT